MQAMLIQMSIITLLYVLLTVLIWRYMKDRPLRIRHRVGIGVIYGICSILSTHFGVDYHHMLINVRDLGPLMAGLYFDPVSGIIAGLIGGFERYIAGTFWGVGTYTRVACSLSTCLAGFVSAGLSVFVFRRRKPSLTYAFCMGAVMEAFHMYVVFITHRDDMDMAFYVVKTCSPGMIAFTGMGMCISSVVLQILSGELKNPFRKLKAEEIPVSKRFEVWLFAVTLAVLLLNMAFAFNLQTESARQQSEEVLQDVSGDIIKVYKREGDLSCLHVGHEGSFDIITEGGEVVAGDHRGSQVPREDLDLIKKGPLENCFVGTLRGSEALCRTENIGSGQIVVAWLPITEVYDNRDAQTYETALADIILFAVIYVLVSLLVQKIVVDNLLLVNASLKRITNGNLNEKVSVRKSSEYASLSDDINQMVQALKGYIRAAEKRFEEDLEMARTIQASALPRHFDLNREDFELYATMDPAKEVGGDFYDFFFVDKDTLALVIADVSGKGIPASLFMMRAKTSIRGLAESGRSPAEICRLANNALCEGNDAEMFVTVWCGILNLTNGHMMCANAGHEYPAMMKAGGVYNLFRNKHSPALATIEGLKFREYEMILSPGDRLFVYTDGIPEAIDENTEAYGSDRLVDVLNKVRNASVKDTLIAVRQDISEFVGEADQFDDITMLGIHYRS